MLTYEEEVLKEQMDEMIKLQKFILAQDELFKLGAQICRKSYLALVTEGFTDEQAIRIVSGGGMNLKGDK